MAFLPRNISFTFFCAWLFSVCSFFFNLLAFVTPYWLRSWPRLWSSFKILGLWEICLDGFVHPHDYQMKSYVGCWWILSSHFEDIRYWLLPAWFVFCQVVMVITIIMDFLLLVGSCALLILRIRNKTTNLWKGFHGKYGPRFMKACVVFGFLNSLFFFVVCVAMAVYSKDPDWMPRPVINRFSWSYGFAVLSGFASTFCSLAYLYELRAMMRHQPEGTDMPQAPKPEMVKESKPL